MSTTTHYGFVQDPGTNFTGGQEPKIAAALDKLARELHKNVIGISGQRTPAHSEAVGGSANDPHTRGQAADIGLGMDTLSSASQISDAELAHVGLWRPFDMTGNNPAEVNHVQLLPSAGGPIVAGEKAPTEKQLVHDALIKDQAKAPITEIKKELGGDAEEAAGKTAKAIVGLFGTWFGETFAKAALYVVLVGGGAALLILGITRAAGLHPKASDAAKVAAAGALA